MDIKDFHAEFFSKQKWPHWKDDDKETFVQDWNDGYNVTCKQVKKCVKNNRALNPIKDYDLLKRIIYNANKDNYVSNAGESRLSKEVFDYLIKRPNFLSDLFTFMKHPNALNFQNFSNTWYKEGHKKYSVQRVNKPLRMNRVAAACINTVSSVAHIYKFDLVFDILTKRPEFNSYVPKIPEHHLKREGIWFQRNEYLLSELSRILKSQSVNSKIDPIWTSMFAWGLFLETQGRFATNGKCRL